MIYFVFVIFFIVKYWSFVFISYLGLGLVLPFDGYLATDIPKIVLVLKL